MMMSKPATPPDLLARIERNNLWLGAAAVAIAGLIWGLSGMAAAGAGAVLACLNFWAVRRLGLRAVRRVANEGRPGAALALVGALVGKMTLLFALVFLAIRGLGLAIVPFSMGISVFVFSILVSGLATGLHQAEGVS